MTNVYIDGFNLFNGAIKGTPYKWLDLVKLSSTLLRGHHIGQVKYFTARVDDRPDDPGQSRRQDIYISALKTLPQVEVYFGLFKTRKKRVKLARPRQDGEEFAVALITEEKGSDVALSIGPPNGALDALRPAGKSGPSRPGPQKRRRRVKGSTTRRLRRMPFMTPGRLGRWWLTPGLGGGGRWRWRPAAC